MAMLTSFSVKHRCGCVVRYADDPERINREEQVKWLEAQDCGEPDCARYPLIPPKEGLWPLSTP